MKLQNWRQVVSSYLSTTQKSFYNKYRLSVENGNENIDKWQLQMIRSCNLVFWAKSDLNIDILMKHEEAQQNEVNINDNLTW